MKQLLFLFFVLFTVTASAQRTEEEARGDISYRSTRDDRQVVRGERFTDNLWFGAGAQLGFQSSNFNSFFQIGLSPIVGYKINNFLSVGPRGSFAYNRYTEDIGNNDRFKSSFITWQAGLFTRAIVFRPFFVHAEYSLVSDVQRFDANGDPIRQIRAIPFLGGGYSQGGGGIGGAGFEVLILFRLSQADRIGDAPFEIRSGVNFNF